MLSVAHLLRAIGSPINTHLLKGAFSTSAGCQAKVALVLSGCGVYDGSEVHEASACLVHLSRSGADVSMFAPNTDQMHVIDHTKGEPMEGQTRNVMVESARIARGKIQDLAELQAGQFDAVVFPGGFGAAKNLSTFAVDGTDMKVNPEVKRVLTDFHSASKVIGLCCISPVLVAKVLPGSEVTVGSDKEEDGKWPYAGTAGAIETMGGKHVNTAVTDAHVDQKNKIVTSPAYMCDTRVHEIFDGIGVMIEQVIQLSKK